MPQSSSRTRSLQVCHELLRVQGRDRLISLVFTLLDANTRQDATQKLETAAHDNYVGHLVTHLPLQSLLTTLLDVAPVYVDALIGAG